MSLIESVVFRDALEDYVGGSGDLIAHDTLDGLADDDHTQYLLANGTRELTADWDAGSFKITAEQLESDVATGTAPLIVASTTLVANLNADKLDGYDESDFDYTLISGNDAATDVTGAELEELTDGSDTTLHIHDATYVNRDEWLQNGFPDASEVSLSWDDASRTLTIDSVGASFRYYHDGNLYTETGTLTEQILDEEGLWVIYIDGEASVTSAKNPSHASVDSVIENECIVAYVYWDAANSDGRLLDELHGANMAPATHHFLHDNLGAQYFSGMALGSMTVDGNGSSDTHAQFAIESGEIYDEDRGHDLTQSTQTETKEVYYTDGSNYTRWVSAEATFPVYAIGGVIAYNNAGTLTAVPSNRYCLYHVFATNIKTDAGADYDCIMVPGEEVYLTKAAARDAAETEILTITTGSWPMDETVAVATVIYHHGASMTNGVEAAIVSTDTGDDYIDWRSVQPTGTGASPTDHGALAGLSDDDHTQYLLADGTRALTAAWDAGSFGITAETFTSDVATGTAPLTVTSTTLVSNLNADLLDGNEASAIDYSFVSGNDGATDITAAQLEELSDGSTTTLHEHNDEEINVTATYTGFLDSDTTLDAALDTVDGLSTEFSTRQQLMGGSKTGISDNTATKFVTFTMPTGPSGLTVALTLVGDSDSATENANVTIQGFLHCVRNSTGTVTAEWVETYNSTDDSKMITSGTFGTCEITEAVSTADVEVSVDLDSSLNQTWDIVWTALMSADVTVTAA
jgi:hypothetical protein